MNVTDLKNFIQHMRITWMRMVPNSKLMRLASNQTDLCWH